MIPEKDRREHRLMNSFLIALNTPTAAGARKMIIPYSQKLEYKGLKLVVHKHLYETFELAHGRLWDVSEYYTGTKVNRWGACRTKAEAIEAAKADIDSMKDKLTAALARRERINPAGLGAQ